MDIIGVLTGRVLLNYVGGTLRYVYGSIWRNLFDRPKFTFKEYINGPKKGDYYDESRHKFNNRIIAFIFLIIILLVLVNYYP